MTIGNYYNDIANSLLLANLNYLIITALYPLTKLAIFQYGISSVFNF